MKGRKEGAFGKSRGSGQNTLKNANDMGAEATLMLTGEWRKQFPRYHFPWKAVRRDTLVSQNGFAVTATGPPDRTHMKEIQRSEAWSCKTPLGRGKAFCTAAQTCPPNKRCRKKPKAGKDRLKVCAKGVHAFKLAPKLQFVHPKLSPQLFS